MSNKSFSVRDNPNDSNFQSAIDDKSYSVVEGETKTASQKVFSANDEKSLSFTQFCRRYEIVRRDQFNNHWDFLVSCVGALCGYSNVWRFPGSAFIYGGGSFLIPYILCMVFIGLPIVTLEMYLGQLSGVAIGRTLGLITPFFAGLGWGMVVLSFFLAIQQGMHVAYCTIYFAAAFQKNVLTWSTCGNDWNTDAPNFSACEPDVEELDHDLHNFTDLENFSHTLFVSPTKEFLYNEVLGFNPDPTKQQYDISFKLAFALLIVWASVCSCLAFGVKIVSKVAYVTTVIPYIGLVILFFRSVTLEGSGEGISAFFTPDISQLAKKNIWTDALLSTIYSLNIGIGLMTTMTSYNPFHNNCQKDGLIVVAIGVFTEIFSGIIVFAGVSHIADFHHIPIQNMTAQGYELGFLIFPEILSRMAGAPFWAILFFLVQIALGIDGLMWVTETVLTEIADVYQACRVGKHRIIMVCIVCACCFGVGLGFCTKASGSAILLMVDKHMMNGVSLLIVVLMEVFVVIYIYGYKRFCIDISLILGYQPNIYYRVTWVVTAPLFTFVLLIVMLMRDDPDIFLGVKFPMEAERLGWILSSLPIVSIFCFAIYRIIKNRYKQKPLTALILPRKRWCPRKKANLAEQKQEIEDAQKGLMGEYDVSVSAQRSIALQGASPKEDSIVTVKSVRTSLRSTKSGKNPAAPPSGTLKKSVAKSVAKAPSTKSAK